jgi:uncharacterized protein YjbI with pentapeptide repeats
VCIYKEMTSVADTIRIRKTEDLQKIPLTTFTRPNKTTYEAYNLEGANLEGANLEGADLKRANLRDANLRDANLRDANLRDANLDRANLTGANLTGADLRDANLEADLEGADLRDANLEGAALGDEGNLKRANLTGANLNYTYLAFVDLQGAILERANLVDTELANANLVDTELANANLVDANLSAANLAGANLSGANLTRATLIGTNLSGANVRNANLTGANLRNANLEDANLTGATLIDVMGFNVTAAPAAPVVQQGVAYEVHRKSGELGSNAKFLTTIGFYKSPRLNSFNYDKVQTKFVNFINDETNFKNSDKGKLVENLKKVLNKAKICGIPIGDKANLLNKAIEFAFQQDSRFTEAYIDIFIDETSKAYSSGTDNMSCVAGIKERFYTSLLGAALQMDTIERFTKTPEIRTLFCIAKTEKGQKDPNEILGKWAKSWEGKDEKWKDMGKEARKEHLKTYMMEEYKKDECYEENKESIENIINEKAKELDYVFENNEDAAQFGGRNHKNKRSLEKVGKSMKNKTKTKRITRKAKQNKKKRITRKAKQNKKKRSVRK